MSTPNDSNERALIDAMREARETLEQNTPPRDAHRVETRERVFAHMEERLARGGEDTSKINMQRLVLATATLALLIGAAILLWPNQPERPLDGPAPPKVAHVAPIPGPPPVLEEPETALALGLFAKPACGASSGDDRLEARAGCELSWPEHSGQIVTHTKTSFTAHARGLHVTRGDVTFDIDPNREHKRELEIVTSGGIVRVIGTKFRVEQNDVGGAVTLERGAITFAPDQGEELSLSPGDTHRWTTRVAAIAPKKKPKRRPKAPKLAPEELEARVEITMKQLTEIKQLRRLGKFDAASSKLNKLEANAPTQKIAEVISYERGDLLTEHADAARACKHWRRHQRRYKRGRYMSDVVRRRDELGCAR